MKRDYARFTRLRVGVVYGGGNLGLMGAVSAGALLAGGEVIRPAFDEKKRERGHGRREVDIPEFRRAEVAAHHRVDEHR